jgi:hypothetical protein
MTAARFPKVCAALGCQNVVGLDIPMWSDDEERVMAEDLASI